MDPFHFFQVGVDKEADDQFRQRSPSLNEKSPQEVKDLTSSDVPPDLFSILFKCHEEKVPYKSLLAHAVASRQPLLGILAACETVSL